MRVARDDLAFGPDALNSGERAESLLSVIEVMTREVERLTQRVFDEVRAEATCRRLMTVPGVGPLTGWRFAPRSISRTASANPEP